MTFPTKKEAEAYLSSCGFVPALRRRHRVVQTTVWPWWSEQRLPCWTVILLPAGKTIAHAKRR